MWSIPDVNHVSSTDRPYMACPARFERATYALEVVKMRLNNSRNNGIEMLKSGVAYAPRTLVSGGIGWIRHGIGRWSNGLKWDLSGKPTFSSALLRDTSLASPQNNTFYVSSLYITRSIN